MGLLPIMTFVQSRKKLLVSQLCLTRQILDSRALHCSFTRMSDVNLWSHRSTQDNDNQDSADGYNCRTHDFLPLVT